RASFRSRQRRTGYATRGGMQNGGRHPPARSHAHRSQRTAGEPQRDTRAPRAPRGDPLETNLAVLIDFENIAAGTEKEGLGRFDVEALMQRVKDKGRILVARSYAD